MRLEKNWMELAAEKAQVARILDTNQWTGRYGLLLSGEDADALMEKRRQTLRETKRVEFGEGILPKIIYEFCDSAYIHQSDYAKTLASLQEIFFHYKNEMMDESTDDELLEFMKEQFETVCFGDLDYLEGTCLDLFAQAIRAGYTGYVGSEGRGEFEKCYS